MARPRTPVAKAKLTGAAAKNPQRFRDRNEPKSKSLGKAPETLDELGVMAWKAFKKEWPWLTEGDRAAMVPLCKMRAEIEYGGGAAAAKFTEYRLMLSAFGGTPTSRTKIHVSDDDEPDDPFAELEGRVN